MQQGDKPELPLTSLSYLNDKLWGLRRKELVVIGGRTSQGKSSLALQIAWDLAIQNYPVHLLSLEMTNKALMKRLFCQQMQVPNAVLMRGGVTPEISAKASVFQDTLRKVPLLITDSIGKTAVELYDLVERLEPKPAVVIVDYIQAIARLRGESYEVMNEYIRRFREMAIEFNFCGILVSQINRGAMKEENKQPALWLLKATGVLEEHADVVLLLHWDYFYRPDEDKKEAYDIIIAKNKDGITGSVSVRFQPEYYRFSDIDMEEAKKIMEAFEGKVM